jgi:hypothetical protein
MTAKAGSGAGRFFTDPVPPRKKSDDFFIGEKPHRSFCGAVQTVPHGKNPIVTPTNTLKN